MKVLEVSVQTEDQDGEDSSEEYFEEEGEEQDDNLDINAKDLLQNMLLENVETYDIDDHEEESGMDETSPFFLLEVNFLSCSTSS